MVPTVSKTEEKSVNFEESGTSQGKFESTKVQKRKADEKSKICSK